VAKAKKKPAQKHIKSAKKRAAPRRASQKHAVQKKMARDSQPKGTAEKMLIAALKVLDDRQAQQIVTIPLAGRSSLADYMIIASGRAGRQVLAMAEYLREAFYKLGVPCVRVEGQSDANWVLVDAGDVIVHLFLPEVRKYYDLDSLWSKRAGKR
jgi:ribosome-associated protein